MNCQNPECGQPLMEIEFAKGYEFVCNNWQCYMYRRPQATRLKEPKMETRAMSYQVRHDVGILSRKGSEAQRQLELMWKTTSTNG